MGFLDMVCLPLLLSLDLFFFFLFFFSLLIVFILAFHDHLWFHMNFRIVFLRSVENII